MMFRVPVSMNLHRFGDEALLTRRRKPLRLTDSESKREKGQCSRHGEQRERKKGDFLCDPLGHEDRCRCRDAAKKGTWQSVQNVYGNLCFAFHRSVGASDIKSSGLKTWQEKDDRECLDCGERTENPALFAEGMKSDGNLIHLAILLMQPLLVSFSCNKSKFWVCLPCNYWNINAPKYNFYSFDQVSHSHLLIFSARRFNIKIN